MVGLVIVNYRDERTRDFATGKRVKAFSGIERSARLKLDRLEAATSKLDLAALPGNRFEALKGKRKGQYSIELTTNGDCVLNGPTNRQDQPTLRSLTITRENF
jgi:proteic killer suppression protein